MMPSTLPVIRYWPSGENLAHSTCDFWPNLICLAICVGYCSSSWSLIAAFPRNKSIVVPVCNYLSIFFNHHVMYNSVVDGIEY